MAAHKRLPIFRIPDTLLKPVGWHNYETDPAPFSATLLPLQGIKAMILNSVDEAEKIYTYARTTFNLTSISIGNAQSEHVYRKTIAILDELIGRLSQSTHYVRYGVIPGDLNGLTSVLEAAYYLLGDVWHGFLTVGPGNYKEDYLSSSAWRNKREHVMHRDGYKCPCGSQATVVHHKHYKNIGKELLEDLVALCDRCHNNHETHKTAR